MMHRSNRILYSPDRGPAGRDPLPQWDLSDFYTGPDDPAINADLIETLGEARRFRSDYQGRLGTLDGDALAAAIERFETITERWGRVGSYSGLLRSTHLDDAKVGQFYQHIYDAITAIRAEQLFFTLEMNELADASLHEALNGSASLRKYEPWLRDIRDFKPHQLSEDLERFSLDLRSVGRSAWMRLYDETLAGLRFPVRDQQMTLNEVIAAQTEPDPQLRHDAAMAMASVLKKNRALFALVTNTLAKDGAIDDEWRGFPRPVSARNLDNKVEDDVVDALATAVKESYPRLSHRYYRLKARWFGQESLRWWERNAPLPWSEEGVTAWEDAKKIILDAYGKFSPALATLAQNFFDKSWLDAAPRPGKDSGAFSHPTVPSVHPYILTNYRGRKRDVMTLAHELGHGAHQLLSAPQGMLMADAPLTLAETASVFGEMLTFEHLLSLESDPKRRLTLIAGKVEDMLNTVVRQIAFHEFETRVHTARRDRELLPDDLDRIWLETQRDSFGSGLSADETYAPLWAYIGHFIHAPFYVYAYAFGDCLVNALYETYRVQPAGFAEKYLDLLRAGGSKRHRELLAPFGLDASDPEFWKRGLNLIARLIDELETLTP